MSKLVIPGVIAQSGNGGGGGEGGTVDQTYDPTSTNAQSGTAVAEAVAPTLKNKATGTGSLQISSTSNTSISQMYVTAIGNVTATGSSGIGISSGNSSCTVSTAGVAIGNALATGSGSLAISPNSFGGATALDSIQLGAGYNSTAKTFQVYQWPLLDGTTGKIPADRIDMLVTVWNFSSSSYLTDKNIIDFESGTSYDFVYHFRTRESGTSEGFFYSTIDYENESAGGFDLTHRPTGLWLVQSKQGGGSWAFDDSIGAINNATDYWLHITWDGTTYTYIIATDKNFTDIFNTTTLVSSLPIKNSTVSSWFGRPHRYSQYAWGSKIYISDCIMKINGVTVFDGAHASNYTIVGNPNMVSLLQ